MAFVRRLHSPVAADHVSHCLGAAYKQASCEYDDSPGSPGIEPLRLLQSLRGWTPTKSKNNYALLQQEVAEASDDDREPCSPPSAKLSQRQSLESAFHEYLARGQKIAGNGDVVEYWAFEADTYSIGILAILKRGLLNSLPQLALALITPVIQTMVLFLVFENLINERFEDPDEREGLMKGWLVPLICFLLMSLELSNEALEGIWKVTFTMRAFGGVYRLPGGPAWVAMVLGFLQFLIAALTVGCSMLVVSQQRSCLEAFTNFVALTFLTEVDNILISSRTVRNFIPMEHEIEVRHAAKSQGREAREEPEGVAWSLRMALCSSGLVLLGVFLSKHILDLAARALDEDEEPRDMAMESAWVCSGLVLINIVMLIGSRMFSTLACAKFISLFCVLYLTADLAILYHTHSRITPSLFPMVPFWFAMLASASGNACSKNPFIFLRCPFSSPLLVWSMLALAVFQVAAMYHFGTQAAAMYRFSAFYTQMSPYTTK